MAHKSTIRYYSKKFKTYQRPDPKSIDDLMQHAQIHFMLQKAQLIEQLNTVLSNTLPVKLSLHCEVMNIENGVLTLCVDNPAWITPLRYEEQHILETMRRKAGKIHFGSMRYKVKQY